MRCAFKHLPRVCCLIMLFGAGICAGAQTASTVAATKTFEVATIKSAAPFDPSKFGPRVSQSRASYTDMSLKYLISYAYDVELPQVSGPGWIASSNYDIVATLPEGAAKEDEKKMLQALLRERFGLAFHIEKREGEVYALVVGKHGAKLKPSDPDPPASEPDAPLEPGERHVGERDGKMKIVTNKDGSSTLDMGTRGTQTIRTDMEGGTRRFERSKMSMKEVAEWMPVCMGAGSLEKYTFVDETGIEGNYQVGIDCPLGFSLPKSSSAGGDTLPSDPQGGSLNRSLDALGMKLEKRKAPIDVYVVDHVEKPSDN